MKQYQTPQFITLEDKVIGGILTIKQFLYLAGGAGIIALLRAFLPFPLFLPLAAVVGACAGGMAFVKISDRPVPALVKNAILYFMKPRLYVWKQEPPPARRKKPSASASDENAIRTIPKLSQSKLQDLAWSLDVKSKESN